MSAFRAALLLVALSAAAARGQASQQTPLGASIDQLTTRPPFDRAIWGIDVEDEKGNVVYAQNSERLMIPASVRKLFSMAAVMSCGNPLAPIPLRFYTTGNVSGGVLHGNLILRGEGDPSLGGRLDEPFGTEYRFDPAIEALQRAGVRRIDGRVLADVSAFDDKLVPPGWKHGNLRSSYSAPVDALAFSENSLSAVAQSSDCRTFSGVADPQFVPVKIDLRCKPTEEPWVEITPRNEFVFSGEIDGTTSARYPATLAATNPALLAAQALDDALRMHGITTSRQPEVLARTENPQRAFLAESDSPRVVEQIGVVLRNSHNLYAEMLFKRLSLGAQPATLQSSLDIERDFLVNELHFDPASFFFTDGSGLAPDNLVTPKNTVAVLRYLNSGERAAMFEGLLAEPGGNGTLIRRFLPLAGRIRAKSGSITGVSALAGIIASRNDPSRLRYFAIYIDHHTGGSQATPLIDEIVNRLADF